MIKPVTLYHRVSLDMFVSSHWEPERPHLLCLYIWWVSISLICLFEITTVLKKQHILFPGCVMLTHTESVSSLGEITGLLNDLSPVCQLLPTQKTVTFACIFCYILTWGERSAQLCRRASLWLIAIYWFLMPQCSNITHPNCQTVNFEPLFFQTDQGKGCWCYSLLCSVCPPRCNISKYLCRYIQTRSPDTRVYYCMCFSRQA